MKLDKLQVKALKKAAMDVFNKNGLASCFAVSKALDSNCRWNIDLYKTDYADFFGIDPNGMCFPLTQYLRHRVSEETTNQRILMILFYAEAHK